MPIAPNRPCRFPGCPALSASSYCDKHRSERTRYDRERGSSTERGYDSRWRRYSKQRLREHPLCEECQRQGRLTAAAVTDHIIPHRGDMTLFWDAANHESKCIACHNRKSATEVIHRG